MNIKPIKKSSFNRSRRSFLLNEEGKGEVESKRTKLRAREGIDDRPQTILTLSLGIKYITKHNNSLIKSLFN